MRALTKKTSSQRGFTIVELMIALTILSSILLLCALMLLALGNMFTKGSNQANTQNVTRNIINDLSYSYEFSSSSPTPRITNLGSSTSWCFGTTRYTFLPQKQLGSQATHVFWRDTLRSAGNCPGFKLELPAPSDIANDPNAVAGSGVELVPDNMGVVSLPNPTYLASGTAEISLTIGMGKFGAGGDFNGAGQCNSAVNSRFCATATLQRTVFRRL